VGNFLHSYWWDTKLAGVEGKLQFLRVLVFADFFFVDYLSSPPCSFPIPLSLSQFYFIHFDLAEVLNMTLLSRIAVGFLCLGALVNVAVGIPSQTSRVICDSLECKLKAKSILSFMNQSVNACESTQSFPFLFGALDLTHPKIGLKRNS
jgi:hypothetical protein